MSLVSPPSSNGWNIPLNVYKYGLRRYMHFTVQVRKRRKKKKRE
jgi:hypothetical protein